MSVFRIEKNKNYTVMSNYHLKETKMSLKAKGLLSLMLSLPENWDYSIAGLVAICKENETAIKTTLDELKEFGYLEVVKKMPNETESGRIEYEYIIYEQKQEYKKQDLENLGVEILCLENPPQLNKDKLNKDKLNIDIYCRVVDYLNQKAGTHYKATTPKTRQFIKARLNEKFTEDDFKVVIDKKCSEWLGTDMEQYLRPETLFGTKFESYLNQKPIEIKQEFIHNNYTSQQLSSLITDLDKVEL